MAPDSPSTSAAGGGWDIEAFDRFYDRYAGAALLAASRGGGERGPAASATTERAFLAAWRGDPDVADGEGLLRRVRLLASAARDGGGPAAPVHESTRDDGADARLAVTLASREALKCNEIAAVLGRSEPEVRRLLFGELRRRARERAPAPTLDDESASS